MNRALIVAKPWIDLILSGEKVWEMRSRPTKIRGKIGLIEKGTGLIVGEVDLVGSFTRPLSDDEIEGTESFHCIDDFSNDKWRFPWQLENAERYEEPIPYEHPKGAVTWVRVDNLLK